MKNSKIRKKFLGLYEWLEQGYSLQICFVGSGSGTNPNARAGINYPSSPGKGAAWDRKMYT
jgi:hypothetical protein